MVECADWFNLFRIRANRDQSGCWQRFEMINLSVNDDDDDDDDGDDGDDDGGNDDDADMKRDH